MRDHSKGVSDLETCVDYFALPGCRCENLNFCLFQFQCSTSLPPNPSSPKIEREGSAAALLSASGPSNHALGCNSSTEKLLDVSSQNSLVLQRSSTATSTSLVLNNEDESLINNDPDVILQQHQGNTLLIMYYYYFCNRCNSFLSFGVIQRLCHSPMISMLL